MITLAFLLSVAQPQAFGADDAGRVLLGELGCAACHDPGRRDVFHKAGPDLTRIGARARADAIRAFVLAPQRAKPGTTMPDLVAGREDVAEALTHYLASLGTVPSGPHDPEAAARGDDLYHAVGCAACHSPRRGTELPGSVPLGPVHDKYTPASLAAFLEAPLEARPSGRMPALGLTKREALDIAHFLTRGSGPAEPFAPDAAKAAEGRRLFGDLGCARCHRTGEDVPAAAFTPLDRADPAKGCLSGSAGPWPSYALDASQVRDLRAALAAPAPSPEQRLRARLAALNCVACHVRDGWGGVPAARNELFGTEDPNLGEAGRLPPPLTGVGAKLQPDWLRKTIAQGPRIRPYVKTRMPAFGGEHGAALAELFAALDPVTATAVEPFAPEKELRDAGRKLLGSEGMQCITCHPFAGQRSSNMMAVDLVDTTAQRLRPEWFHAFMRDPAQVLPGTIMPGYFPNGRSVLKTVYDGDPARQIQAMWTYLAAGRNQPAPSGLVQPSMEILVGDEAVVLRRSVQDSGKRAIAVGYPGQVNLAFDAESVALNQVWTGRFIDPAPVWTGQGSGQARPLGEGRTQLPKGPAFFDLADPAAPWTSKSSRELDYRFKGYRLDKVGRPTFLYEFGELRIADAPVEDGTGLRRTLTLEGPARPSLYFRAAVDPEIRDLGDGRFHVGRRLEIRAEGGVVRPGELLVPVRFREDRASFVIEYRWRTP